MTQRYHWQRGRSRNLGVPPNAPTKAELYAADPEGAVMRQIVKEYHGAGLLLSPSIAPAAIPDELDRIHAAAQADPEAFYTKYGSLADALGVTDEDEFMTRMRTQAGGTP